MTRDTKIDEKGIKLGQEKPQNQIKNQIKNEHKFCARTESLNSLEDHYDRVFSK